MTEQVADHRQPLAERQRAGSERMSQVMKADVFEPGLLAHAVPRVVEVDQAGAFLLAREHPGTAGRAGEAVEHARDGGSERHHPGTRFRVGEPHLAGVEVEVVPPKSEISLRRQPVSTRSRMAAAAWVEASRSAGAARSASPSRNSSSRVRNRSCFSTRKRGTPRHGLAPEGRQPHPSARLNIFTKMSAARLATVGMWCRLLWKARMSLYSTSATRRSPSAGTICLRSMRR